MPITRVGVQAVTGSPGQLVDIDPARITATITNAGTVAVEYSTGGAWTSIAPGASASVACDTHDLRLRRGVSGAYPAPVDIDWTATSEGEGTSLTEAQARAVQSLVSGAWKLDPTSWPMSVPAVAGSPPTVARGAANGSTALAGSVLVPADRAGAFRYLGGPKLRTTQNPNFQGYNVGAYPQITSTAITAVEARLYLPDATGRFEIYHKGTAQPYRLLYRQPGGVWQSVTAQGVTLPSDGNLYLELVTLGAAGLYEIRIEYFFGVFMGLRVGPTASVTATKRPAKRIIVAGDSFTEPTISDAGAYWFADGWVPRLAYMTGYDIWCAGSGGTGYVKVNGGRPKLRDRLQNDILSYPADEYWVALGLNDNGEDPATVAAECAACITQIKAARPSAVVRVFSPFAPHGAEFLTPSLLQLRDVIKAAATAAGVPFYDFMDAGAPDWVEPTFSTSLTAATTSGSTSITVGSIPAYFGGSVATAPVGDMYLKLGAAGAATQTVKLAQNYMTGTSGAYVISLASAVGYVFPVGTPVQIVGQAYLTGNGKQGTPAGNGNADLFTGPDGTHPTVLGHANIAAQAVRLLTA